MTMVAPMLRMPYPNARFTFSAKVVDVYGFWIKPDTRWPVNM